MTMPAVVPDRFYARACYDTLVIRQPQVKTTGLWRSGDGFVIVCPNLPSERADDGQPLTAWFAMNKVLGAPVTLASDAPANAVLVPARTAEELAEGIGDPRTLPATFVELVLSLPKEFPDFGVGDEPATLVITVGRNLTTEEFTQLDGAVTGLGTGLPWRLKLDPTFAYAPTARRSGDGDLSLIPSKALSPAFGKEFRWLWEADEDFWSEQRVPLLAQAKVSTRDVLPASFRSGTSACLVRPEFGQNVRTYLPLYSRTILTMPIAEHLPLALEGLRCTEEDLVALARTGRVQFLLPQSPDRYEARLVHRLAEEAPKSLVLSRRLAAATIADMQRRGLIHYPPIGVQDRAAVLAIMSDFVTQVTDPQQQAIAKAGLRHLKEAWSWGSGAVQRMGAQATVVTNNVGTLFAAIFEAVTGQNLQIELSVAAGDVQWAGTLGATVFPASGRGYSAQAATELCSALYSGVQRTPVPTNFGDVQTVLHGVVGLDNDAPVSDVASAFDGPDVDALRAAIHRIAEPNLDPGFLQDAVARFNARVTAYEKAVERQAKWDVRGGAAAIAGLAGVVAAGVPGLAVGAAAVPVGTWLFDRLGQALAASAAGARLLDRLNAANAITSADVVLVSRLRQRIAE